MTAIHRTTISRMCRHALIAALLLLPLQGCLQASIEGEWEVRCHPAGDDCPNFTVSFDAQGGIVALDLWGENSDRSGFGSIKDDTLEININNVFVFRGKLEGPKRQATGSLKDLERLKKQDDLEKLRQQLPAVAQGTLDDHDVDGDDVIVRATARRIGPLKRT